jgi:hypothetical protein
MIPKSNLHVKRTHLQSQQLNSTKIFENLGAFFAASRKKPGFAGVPSLRMAYGPAPRPLRAPPIPCARTAAPLWGECHLLYPYPHQPPNRNLKSKSILKTC